MTERMTSDDALLLHRETPSTPRHVGAIAIFLPPPAGFAYERLVRLIEERLALAPRYRQKIRTVPGRLGNPLWLDDPHFDITYHVRRSALPRPGTDAQLLDFSARVQSRMLDRSRPLWEMYLVEGLTGGRLAIVTKTHEAVVRAPGGVDIAQLILDAAPEPRRTVAPLWMPRPEPPVAAVVRDAAAELVRHPSRAPVAARDAARELRQVAARSSLLVGALGSGARLLAGRRADSPLHTRLGQQRRMAIARTRLADYRAVRNAFGGTVDDAMLAVVTGALRGWLLTRGQPLGPTDSVRTLVPITTIDAAQPAGAQPSVARARPMLVDLPVGEPDAVLRHANLRHANLRHANLRHAMGLHRHEAGAVCADRIAALRGFAPPTLHALGARTVGGLTRRGVSLVITHVPGPQQPRYAAGARMSEIFPVLPLTDDHAVSIALTSYDGSVFYGLTGDRDALRDIGTVAELIVESLAELTAAAGARGRVRTDRT
jgi:diacylglycerol O-acyltransferase